MKNDQMLIFDASSFDVVKDNKKKSYNVLQAVHFDRYDNLKAEAVFTSLEVVSMFDGCGLYNVSTTYGSGIVGIKKVADFRIP